MNCIRATITACTSSGILNRISLEASGIPLTAFIFEEHPAFTRGRKTNILFKETDVGIGTSLSGEISCSNRFPAIVRDIRMGELLAALSLESAAGPIKSVIQAEAVLRMGLAEGMKVEVLLRATGLSLESAKGTVP